MVKARTHNEVRKNFFIRYLFMNAPCNDENRIIGLNTLIETKVARTVLSKV